MQTGKLKSALYEEAHKEYFNEKQPSYKIEVTGSSNSCLLKIGKQRFRSLVDSCAEVSLLHKRVYDSLKFKPKLIKRKVNLQ